jgi:hypothetical protein
VKDEATGRCEYKPARLMIEFGLLAKRAGGLRVRVTKKAEWEVYDEYAVNAIQHASPLPPVPPALMALAKPGNAGVRIRAAFEYKVVDPHLR